MGYRQDFIEIFTQNIQREGAQELLSWIETTDFFTAPASTKFHCACELSLIHISGPSSPGTGE